MRTFDIYLEYKEIYELFRYLKAKSYRDAKREWVLSIGGIRKGFPDKQLQQGKLSSLAWLEPRVRGMVNWEVRGTCVGDGGLGSMKESKGIEGVSHSVMSDALGPSVLQPTRLLCP